MDKTKVKPTNTTDTASDSDVPCPNCGAAAQTETGLCHGCADAAPADASPATTQDTNTDASGPSVFYDAHAVGDEPHTASGPGSSILDSAANVDGGTIVIDCGAPETEDETPDAGHSAASPSGRLVGAGVDVKIRLGEGCRFVVGRDHRSCDVVVADTRVSREHFAVEHTPAGAVLNDLRSTNGTYLNGARVDAPVALKDGDRIRFGRLEVQYLTV